MVLIAVALAAVTTATIISAGCMAPTPSPSSATATPAAAPAPVAATRQTPANAAPNTDQASLAQIQGEGRLRSVPVRRQKSDAVLKKLPSVEGDNVDPAAQPISIEFSGGLKTANGVVSGYLGCNCFSGPYEKFASGMHFGNLVSTRVARDPTCMELETALLEALKSPLATVGMQPSASGKQGRQVVWKTTSSTLLQFAERPLSPHDQAH